MRDSFSVMESSPAQKEWPEDGKERVTACPVCRFQGSTVVHDDLQDRIFFSAPGTWRLRQCRQCQSAYLDPRPTRETIHLAYESYHTHSRSRPDSSGPDAKHSGLRTRLANGYRNWRYGTAFKPATGLGLALILWPPRRKVLDRRMRHLPKLSSNSRLLDVGFGNARFLATARAGGWDVRGVDFDAEVVQAARDRGLAVELGGIEVLDGEASRYDAITLSHVIEHVHEPLEMLRDAYRLLRPGGYLWIETPNVLSIGHERFGADWRGLEPPRHLVIFNWQSLMHALEQTGFERIKPLPNRSGSQKVYEESCAIRSRRLPGHAANDRLSDAFTQRIDMLQTFMRPRRSELVTLSARKPPA